MVGLLQPTVEEGYQLLPRPLGAQCQGYRVQTVDGVESEQHVVVLELVDEDGNRVQLVILVGLHVARL